ncbi:hypothetical protein B0H13DRAFT_2390505 [Mycena leptocephala]|nr:hypothetical protein B0H13DRAFT_2390505 [Mycena leptocephala]
MVRRREPGAINGHTTVQLHAAPSNDRVWNLEVPYASDSKIQETLTKYGSGVIEKFVKTSRRLTSPRSRKAGVLGPSTRPYHLILSMSRESMLQLTRLNRALSSGYVTHPEGSVPPFDISRMREIGRTPSGDHVLQFPDRPQTTGAPPMVLSKGCATMRAPAIGCAKKARLENILKVRVRCGKGNDGGRPRRWEEEIASSSDELEEGELRDSLFDFEDDSDSPPELLDEDSSEEHTSSAEDFALANKFETMRQAAPTPDRNPEVRTVAMDDLVEWCRRQAQLQEGVWCSENHRALFPLREGLEIVHLYLEDLIDRDAMALEARGRQSWSMALTNPDTTAVLESISQPAGDGKRKICNEFILAVARDGVWLQDYLAPLINLRGFILSCMGQLNVLAVRQQYSIDVSHVNQTNDTLTPVLDWGERAKLTCLQHAFASAGQLDVANQLDTFLKLRFRDARILARLLYANVFDAEDYIPDTVDDEAVQRDMCAAECMLSSASISPPPLMDHANNSNLQPIVPRAPNARIVLLKPRAVFLDFTVG